MIDTQNRFEETTIELMTNKGRAEFEAWVYGETGLGFHKCITCHTHYRVSHILTGLSLTRFHYQFQDALDLITEIAKVDFDWKELKNNSKYKSFYNSKIRPLLQNKPFAKDCIRPEPDEIEVPA